MKVLLLSTYELGYQPLGSAGPASLLMSAGHDVEAVDLAVQPWPGEAVASAHAVIFSVPMHTATELALRALERIVHERERPPLAFLGLYAGLLSDHPLLGPGDLVAAGEAGDALLSWLGTISSTAAGGQSPQGARAFASIGPAALPRPLRPARSLLPPLDSYARFVRGDSSLLAAGVEATRGCNHACRHCPVPVLYNGRSRAVPIEAVMEDVASVVELGASHLSFLDPDFLNRPRHALALATELHATFPSLSFDATVKVEHVLSHADVWPVLFGLGLTHVTSAFESTDDHVLSLLDKGHTAADEERAVGLLRSAGVEVRPSWLPFNPWTTPRSIASLLELTARADLVWNTDAVQYSIRLLLPKGSLLLSEPDPVLAEAITRAGPAPGWSTSVPWRHADPLLDGLQEAVAAVVEAATGRDASPEETFSDVWSACREAGAPLGETPPEPAEALRSPLPGPERPSMSEAWFCCAEPTGAQLKLVQR